MEPKEQKNLGKNYTAQETKQKISKTPSEKLHLPVVMTSQIARNRLDQMRTNMQKIKELNPQVFGLSKNFPII